VRAALYGLGRPPRVVGFVAGLGGRDVTIAQILQAAELATTAGVPGLDDVTETWVGLKEE